MASMFHFPRRSILLVLVLIAICTFVLNRINVTSPYCPVYTKGLSESSSRSFSKFLPRILKESSSKSELFPKTVLDFFSKTNPTPSFKKNSESFLKNHLEPSITNISLFSPIGKSESSLINFADTSESLPKAALESAAAKSPSESLSNIASESAAARNPSDSLSNSALESAAAKSPSESLSNSASVSSSKNLLLSLSKNASEIRTEEKCSLLQNMPKPLYTIIEDETQDVNKTFFTLNYSKVSDIPQDFSITGSNICDPRFSTILFVGPSVVNSETNRARLAIRTTWASSFYGNNSLQTSKTRLAFFFGSLGLRHEKLEILKKESDIFKDVVVGNFKDSYGNLSLKMTVIISWVAKYCPNVEAMVKFDMDTFVNVELLLGLLQELPSKTYPKYVLGKQHNHLYPPAVRSGKWAVPESMYPLNRFPKYVLGHSYVVSGSAVKLLAESFPYFPIIPNEDAFVTGIMPVVLNITKFGSSFADTKTRGRHDKLKKNMLVSVILKRRIMKGVWNLIKDQKCDHSK